MLADNAHSEQLSAGVAACSRLPHERCIKADVLACAGALRRHRNAHEARETYKTLKDQNIGDAATCAALYADWAGLEVAAGERERALGILRKGLKAGVQPARWAPTPVTPILSPLPCMLLHSVWPSCPATRASCHLQHASSKPPCCSMLLGRVCPACDAACPVGGALRSELQALEAQLGAASGAGSRTSDAQGAAQQQPGAATHHSAATTFLPTPSMAAERGIRDFTHTAGTFDVTLSAAAASGQARIVTVLRAHESLLWQL